MKAKFIVKLLSCFVNKQALNVINDQYSKMMSIISKKQIFCVNTINNNSNKLEHILVHI